jgi:hypothetical protein
MYMVDGLSVNPLYFRFLGKGKYTGLGLFLENSTLNKKNNSSLPPRCTTDTTSAKMYYWASSKIQPNIITPCVKTQYYILTEKMEQFYKPVLSSSKCYNCSVCQSQWVNTTVHHSTIIFLYLHLSVATVIWIIITNMNLFGTENQPMS